MDHHRAYTVPLLKSGLLDSEVDSCHQVQTNRLGGGEEREEGEGEGQLGVGGGRREQNEECERSWEAHNQRKPSLQHT